MEFPWTAPDGVTFPCHHWEPAGSERGTVICIHGLGGAATDFDTLARHLSAQGLSVYAMNLRGQGHDPVTRRRGAFFDLAGLERDIVAFGGFVLSRSAGGPVFWCGESMGSLLLSHLLHRKAIGPDIAGAILSVPVVELKKPTPPPIRAIVRFAARLAPDLRLHPGLFVTGKSKPIPVTRDEEHIARIRASSHYIPVFTIGFLSAFSRLMDSTPQLAGGITVPTLVLSAGQDVFIRPEQIARWYDLIPSTDKQHLHYPEAYHLLWNDWGKDAVLSDISTWVADRSALVY